MLSFDYYRTYDIKNTHFDFSFGMHNRFGSKLENYDLYISTGLPKEEKKNFFSLHSFEKTSFNENENDLFESPNFVLKHFDIYQIEYSL